MGITNIASKAVAKDAAAKAVEKRVEQAAAKAMTKNVGKAASKAMATDVGKTAAKSMSADALRSAAKSSLGLDSLKLSAGALKHAKGAEAKILNVSFNQDYLASIEKNEPIARAAKNNTDKEFFRFLNSTKKTLDGAFYDIEDTTAAQKIIEAHKRGVKVRLVTDTDNLVDKLDPTKPREAIQMLKKAGIPIVDDQRSAIMHHKFLVADGDKVWMGSTNLTPTSLYRHNNNTITLQSKELSGEFTDEFNRLFEKHQFGVSVRPEIAPNPPIPVKGGGTVQAFFSPEGGGKDAVLKELQGAKKSVKFMTFSLTDKEMGDTLVQKSKAGVKVAGVFDARMAAGPYSLFPQFKEAGIPVLRDGNEALLHHKVMIVDNKTVITGSFNYSTNAELHNNEAFLIFRNNPQVVKDYSAEFERVRHAAQHNHPPLPARPDAEIVAANKTGA